MVLGGRFEEDDGLVIVSTVGSVSVIGLSDVIGQSQSSLSFPLSWRTVVVYVRRACGSLFENKSWRGAS